MESSSLADYVQLKPITASNKSITSNVSNVPSSSTEISLFPMLDVFLKILPVYYTKGRNKYLNGLIIFISIIALLSLPIFQIYEAIILGYNGKSAIMIEDGIFVFIMYFFPFCGSFARLYFFAKYFDFKIWHYQSIPLLNNHRISTVSTDSNQDNISYLLRQSSNIKNKIRQQFRIGALVIVILITIFNAISIWVGIVFYSLNINDLKQKEQIKYEQITWYSIQYLMCHLPDMFMIFVSRLYFTECYLYILRFTESINVITSFSSSSSSLLDDMISFDIHGKYLKMYDKISTYCHQLNYFVGFWVLTISFVYWFLITICFFTEWRSYNISFSTELATPLYIQFSIFAVQAMISLIFMLWPAFKMTELFKKLKDTINDQIQILLRDRIYLHEDKLLDGITKNNNYENINITDLHKNISIYSKQKSCLEILSQVSLTMIEKPCSYQLFGLSLDRYSIRDFIVAIFIGKIVSFLWNGIS